MDTQKENVSCVYDDNRNLIAIIKRDNESRKHLVYMVKEATVEEIEMLISSGKK